MKRYIKTAVRTLSEESDDFRRELAQRDNTSPRDLAQLAESNNRYIRRDVARNRNLPMEARLKLLKDDDLAYYDAIYYGDFTPEFLDTLAHDPNNWRFLQAISQHKNTSPKTLAWLVDTVNNDYVLSGVAGNRNTSSETLAKLAGNQNYALRQRVALNPSTPVEILKKLANKDKSVRVRRCAAAELERRREQG